MREAGSGSGSPRQSRSKIGAETRLDPCGKMSGIGSLRIWQFLHFRRIAVKPLELGEIVEGATRYVVDEGLRRSAVGKDDLVGLGLDEKDPRRAEVIVLFLSDV